MHELLRASGSMEEVNLKLEREKIRESSEGLEGGWHTEASLLLLPGWDEILV